MATAITWDPAAHGEVAVVDGLHVTVLSDRPYPPGAPARGTLHDPSGDRVFTLKVAGSRRVGTEAPPRYEVRGRLVSATVDVREAFARAVTPSAPV